MTANFSIGLVEVSGLGNAIIMLDDMCKVADVEFAATERKLGGRLVTIVVKGELTAVKASVDAGVARAKALDVFKAAQVIARPHEEILPFLHLDEKEVKKEVTAEPKKAATPKKTTTRKSTAKKTAAKKTN